MIICWVQSIKTVVLVNMFVESLIKKISVYFDEESVQKNSIYLK